LYNFIEESKSWTICSWMFLTYLISWISLMSEVFLTSEMSLTSWMSLTSEVSLTSWISLTSEMFLTSWMSLTSFACQKSLKSLYHLTHRQSLHSCSTAFSFETAKSLCFLIWKWIHSSRIFREKNEWDSSRYLWLRKDDVVHVITCSNILHFFISVSFIHTHIFIWNSYLDCITQRHASHANHAHLIKINRLVLIKILRIEFLNDKWYCKIIKMNARNENIFDIF